MSIESSESRIPEEALNAFLDGLLAELRSPTDPATLDKVRSTFRKRVPLHLRSYAAALLIMRAAGIARISPSKAPIQSKFPPASQAKPQTKTPAPSDKKPSKPPSGMSKGPAKAASGSQPGPTQASSPPKGDEPRRQSQRRSLEGAVPLFVSMGKRQRLKPQELRDLIAEKTGITEEELGRVNLFDNYSFIDVKDTHVERILSACSVLEIKGRSVEIQMAKKKGESSESVEPAQDQVSEGAKPE
ncbi:MAG TPA: DbpA RNA binding domain-containing protein [Rectinemataceae bacterium]